MAEDNISYNPLYLQVKDIILKRIIDAVYLPGSLIPSESKLSADFKISISTIRQALSILVSDGILEKKQGKGTFISKQKTKLSFLGWMGMTKRGQNILMHLIASFEKNNPSISIEYIPSTYNETKGKLLQLISNGGAPDITQIAMHWTSFFASMGALEPLDNILSTNNLKTRFYKKDLLGGIYLKKLYSVSWGLCPVSLIANKNVLKEAGIQNIKSPMTLDDFLDICKRIDSYHIKNKKYCYGLCISENEMDFLRIYTFLLAFRGGFIDDEGNIIFNSNENIRGFKWLRNFLNSFNIFTSDIYTLRKRLAKGDIAFISDGPWAKYLLEAITGEDFNKNFQVVLNPINSKFKSCSWNYNHGLAICSQGRNKVYAAKFIDSITNDYKMSKLHTLQTGLMPTNKNFLDDPAYDSEYYDTYKKQLKNTIVINAQNPMFEKAMVLCVDAVKKILIEGVDINKELNEKQYYLKMLYYS